MESFSRIDANAVVMLWYHFGIKLVIKKEKEKKKVKLVIFKYLIS